MTLLTKPVSRETKPFCAIASIHASRDLEQGACPCECPHCNRECDCEHKSRLAQSREAVAGLDKVREGFNK